MSSSLIDAVRPRCTTGIDIPAELGEDEQRNLLHALTAVPDLRRRRGGRYRLASLLAVAVCAVLAGATTFPAIADWATDLDEAARARLGFTGRIPPGVRSRGGTSSIPRRPGLAAGTVELGEVLTDRLRFGLS
jgi:hypothetical protein